MTTPIRLGLRVALAGLLALSGSLWSTAYAQLTPAGVSIQNRATVNYSVGGVPQTLIESSPTGNTTPGAGVGVNTTFVVDNLIDLTVAESSGNATVTSPGATGATGAVLAYTVTNTGNASEGYQLSFSEEVGTVLFGNTDSFNIGALNLQIRVDEDPSSGGGTGNDTYDGTETATAINTLAPGASITVFVLGNIPLSALNGAFANIRLQARTAVAGSNGATLEVQSPGVNNPATVEIVFGDAGNDATESAADQYAIQSAALTVTKAATVISDPFGSPSPRAVPGAVVEYTITVANGGVTTATGVAVSDPLPANTAFRINSYGPGNDVQITGGAVPTCVVETPTDVNGDGCFNNGTSLIVNATALGNIAASASKVVRFRVQIN
jgi:uncharacterized repeat protein (TIGR01451 family)